MNEMETALQLLNKRYVIPFAMAVFTVFTAVMVAGCLINYNTTFFSFNARVPYPAAITATIAIQVVQFAIPILLAWNIFEFLQWDTKTKAALFVVWAAVSMIDILTAFYWFVSARQDVVWLDYVIALGMSLWFCLAEYGVVLGAIGMLVSFSLLKFHKIPDWLLTAGEPAVQERPVPKVNMMPERSFALRRVIPTLRYRRERATGDWHCMGSDGQPHKFSHNYPGIEDVPLAEAKSTK
jgi:hypothetical protein